MKFNQELIEKARKGEIAILNDGSVEELREVIKECWPDSKEDLESMLYRNYFERFKMSENRFFGYTSTTTPAHSVKDFFMTEKINSPGPDAKGCGHDPDNPQLDPPPRTYRVTRQQMKEIWEASKEFVTDEHIVGLTKNLFGTFSDAEELTQMQVKHIVAAFPTQQIPDLLKSIFPEYFHIPEGEPVLCRDNDGDDWNIQISDGMGGAYSNNRSYGGSVGWKQIIPFTKNPPK